MVSKKPYKAGVERSDTCAVPAAGVVAEAVVAFEIASAMIEKFGGDNIDEMKRNFLGYEKHLKARMEMEEDQKK
jgi:chorismate synthase